MRVVLMWHSKLGVSEYKKKNHIRKKRQYTWVQRQLERPVKKGLTFKKIEAGIFFFLHRDDDILDQFWLTY
jgi:hypothetical protein